MADAGRHVAPVIAIDGPGGSGKGTVAGRVAGALGWHLLDSGALYRIVAWAGLERGIALADGERLAELATTLRIAHGAAAITVDGHDVTEAIRAERISAGSSEVARQPPVRAALRAMQLAMRRPPGLVADGRDMGTVVFPDAALKVFLDASAEERARRRHRQLLDKTASVKVRDDTLRSGADGGQAAAAQKRAEKGEGGPRSALGALGDSYGALLAGIRARDERDRTRAVSPLRPAADAVTIDTTHLSIDAVVGEVLRHARRRRLEAAVEGTGGVAAPVEAARRHDGT